MFVNEEELTEIEKKEKLLKDIQRIIGIGENTTADYQCGYNYAISKIGYIIRDKDKEIERLNNIINNLNNGIKELDNMFYETFRISQNGYYSISEWELKGFTDKLQELKGSDK